MVVKSRIRAKSPYHKAIPSALNKRHKELDLNHVAIGAAAVLAAGALAAVGLYISSRQKQSRWDAIFERSQNAGHAIKDTLESIRDSANPFTEREGAMEFGKNPALLGIVGATLLGATAVYFLNKDSHGKNRFDAITNQATGKWNEISKLLLNKVSQSFSDADHYQKEGRSLAQNVLEWTSFGLNLWDEFNKRRR